jgi:nitrite reductase/ring-hydroxylating ferredoxin subunit
MELIARIDDIPSRGTQFTYREGPFDERGILLRLSDGTVRAYKNECRHLPMPLDDREPGDLWDPSGAFLVCNSHGARYRSQDGRCVSGPCEGSHLKSLPIVVRNGHVYLETDKLGSFFDV